MLEIIIQFLNFQLESTGYFEKRFSLCDILYKGDGKSFPAQYTQGGAYQEINNFSKYNGVSYFRKSGSVRMIDVTDRFNRGAGCETMIQLSFPLRLVCVVPKEKAPSDNAFTDDSIAMSLMKVLSTKNAVNLKSALVAAESISFVTGYTTDNSEILKQEYSGLSLSDIDYKFSCIALEMSVDVVVKQSCIPDYCDAPLYGNGICYTT